MTLRTMCAACALILQSATATAQADEPQRLQVFTHNEQSWIAPDAVGLRYRGAIEPRLVDDLKAVLQGNAPYRHVVLELDSEGGSLDAVREAVAVLRDVRRNAELTTRVLGGAVCASGCIALFMQGEKRKASGASVWIFHGACSAHTNVPSLKATGEYLDLLTESGVSTEFTCALVQKGYVMRPGTYTVSGYELFHELKANIITELLPAWQPEEPYGLQLFVPR